MSIKKKRLIIIIAISAVFLVVAGIVVPKLIFFIQFANDSKWAGSVRDFDQHQPAFASVVDEILTVAKDKEIMPVNDEEMLVFSIKTDSQTQTKRLYLWNIGPAEGMGGICEETAKISDALGTVKKTMSKNFVVITCRRDRVVFQLTNGRYALVYTFDHQKPDYNAMRVSDVEDSEKTSPSVREIGDGWYEVAPKIHL